MSETLDVLVLENHRNAGRAAVAALEAAGHHVHRCYELDSRGFPCRAIRQPGSCPLDHGIDVTLVVRDRIEPRPTRFEVGVGCSIRSGVPVVEQGPEALDPFAPWVARRIEREGDVAAGVATAAEQAWDDLRHSILDHVRTVIHVRRDAEAIDCDFERHGTDLMVHLAGPTLGDRIEKAVAVRVLDAIWDSERTYGQVDVTYHHRD